MNSIEDINKILANNDVSDYSHIYNKLKKIICEHYINDQIKIFNIFRDIYLKTDVSDWKYGLIYDLLDFISGYTVDSPFREMS